MIPKSFIQDLLNRVDIVDVVERYVPLKKAGANYIACCPFHNEKSPSFTVSQTKQFYHCFGCGVHGTAIGFVMEHAGLGFVEAVQELARSIGLEVPREQVSAAGATKKVAPDLYEIMNSALRYYRDQLKHSTRAIDYLKGRGLSGEIAAKYGIGYAPEGWQNLAAPFPEYQAESLVETGLVITTEEAKRYDRFRDRIMFPIANVRGQIIAFGGRVLDKGEPKYLNSPETSLFEKGREMYGLFQAQKKIREVQKVLVVEGYMDVVALAQHGVEYAVATLGTATTAHHVQKLLRLAESIIFCFDGDNAGQRAAWRALENALPYLQDGKRINFLFLPKEHDPDSFVRQFGRSVFEKEVDAAMPLSAYMLRKIRENLDLTSSEGRSQLLQRAKPLLAAIQAPATALLMRKEVAALSGISQSELEALFEINPVVRELRVRKVDGSRRSLSVNKLLLQCLLARTDLGQRMPEEWSGDDLESETIRSVMMILRETDFQIGGAALVQMLQGTVHEKILANAQADMLTWGEQFDVEAEFLGLLDKVSQELRRKSFRTLQLKCQQGGLSSLTEDERKHYLQLLQRV